MKEGPISQLDSTTTNPTHWSGDMYQEHMPSLPVEPLALNASGLNRPTTHWCQPSPLPPTPLFSLPVLHCKLRQHQWGHRTSTPPHCNHTLPLEPTINPHNASEINTAKPDPHTASKGAPAATQPEDQCGPHLMPV